MPLFLDVIEVVIFLSYFVISCLVGYVYVRHRRYIDTCVNLLLLVTAGLFLMLCALTHLLSIWYPAPPEHLLFACSVVSFVAAACSLVSFRDLDNYLRRRVTTTDLLREQMVLNLTQGYDLKVTVVGNDIISGVAGSHEISEPHFVAQGFGVNSIIPLGETYFRIVHIVDSLVQVPAQATSIGDDEEERAPRRGLARQNTDWMNNSTSTRQVYGYDATAEVHMKEESDRLNRMKMALCLSTAHHVRTPLSCLGVALACLKSRMNMPESISLADDVFVHYDIIDLIVRQFVDIATIDTPTTQMKPCKDFVDIRKLMRRVDNVLVSTRAEEVLSRCVVEDGFPKFVLTDGDWLLQILLSVVISATRHTHSGWITTEVTLLAPTTLLSIVVRDQASASLTVKNGIYLTKTLQTTQRMTMAPLE
ncbi:unnamed protein product [Ectocarpus sp. 12 AP-2014]